MIVVQLIEVIWTKASRGAPASCVRNSVPSAMPLLPTTGEYIYQRQLFRERDGFKGELVESRVSDSIPHVEGELRFYPQKDLLRLGLGYSGKTGKPVRSATNSALTIEEGQLARLITNGRHTSYSGQWYRQATYNVSLVGEVYPDLFINREPDRLFSMEADLF